MYMTISNSNRFEAELNLKSICKLFLQIEIEKFKNHPHSKRKCHLIQLKRLLYSDENRQKRVTLLYNGHNIEYIFGYLSIFSIS